MNDIIGKKAVKKIKKLKDGEIILLDNVRLLDEESVEKKPEEHSKGLLVQTLAPLADFFVNDAFSASHRSHASLVGFTSIMPSLVGRSTENEIKSIRGVIEKMKTSKHDTFILGGAKPDEPLNIMVHMLSEGTLEKVLVSGVIGNLFLIAYGYDLGKPTMKLLKQNGYLDYLPQVKELLKKYKSKIIVPLDVSIEVNKKRKEILVEELPVDSQIMDIGTRTIEKYTEIIMKSKNIVMKGPAGVYEKRGFEMGTRKLLESIKASKGVSLVGGGHTLSALNNLKIDKNGFSNVSLAGGALIIYLSGKKLPALEALRNCVNNDASINKRCSPREID